MAVLFEFTYIVILQIFIFMLHDVVISIEAWLVCEWQKGNMTCWVITFHPGHLTLMRVKDPSPLLFMMLLIYYFLLSFLIAAVANMRYTIWQKQVK